MYHVDNSTGVPVMPQPSPVTSETELFFTEGGNGVPPTFPGPDWFNIIQSELINILRAAGLDPDKMDNTQILAALKKLFLSRSNPFGDIKADGAAAIATALSNLGIIDGLDFTGDISAPNMRCDTTVTVGDGTGGIVKGGVDGAGFNGNNLNIKSWNGIGFQCSADGVIRAYISAQLGIITASEYVYAGSANLYKNGDVYGDKWSTGNGPNWLSLFLEHLDSQIRNNLTSWTSNNFPTKSDVSVALSGKPGRQYITQIGVYQNDKSKPFMLHDDDSGIFLATLSSVHLDANGWHRDASTGVITQWGSGNVPGSQQQRVNFPMTFPNTCTTVIASDTGNGSIALSTMSKDNGGFTVRGASSTFGFNWFAIGY
ncbi:hypothetical protein FDQ58_12410 [Salmonella enterica subsp. enterica serovar Schwarzengrund]|nr:hypothetical protein [Salmonella enterica subsp. enterica serovar Schwarzengrund]